MSLNTPDSGEQQPAPGVRVRFAPSPTGTLHIGGARTALFNYLYARKNNGVLVLRIEDTDRQRSTPEAVQVILDGLRYLGLEWDEGPEIGGDFGPYFQSQRSALHRKIVDRLLRDGKAYRCFCSKDRLDEMRARQREAKQRVEYDRRCRSLSPAEAEERRQRGEASVVRFAVEEGKTEVDDLIRGRVVFNHVDIDDFILQRADGSCVYNLAVVGDDAGMGITHVIRGEDHLSNSPKQILLLRALGERVPAYAHIPLILGPGRQKLSKRHGAVSVTDYQDQGYLPEAMVNFLVRMGWSYDDKQEIFSVAELVEKFSLKGISKAGAMYDLRKLSHLGSHWLQARPEKEVVELTLDYVLKKNYLSRPTVDAKKGRLLKMVALEKDRADNVSQIAERLRLYFEGIGELEPKAADVLRQQKAIGSKLAKFADLLEEVFDGDDPQTIEEAARNFADDLDMRFKDLAQATRVVLSGRTRTPPLFDVMVILGKDICLKRLRSAAELMERAPS